jgi:16S rRNA (guanine527-N7)-methyltransferase
LPDDEPKHFPLNDYLEEAGLSPLPVELCNRFAAYLSLILKWNGRMNLTAVREAEGILKRHFVESIACARVLPSGIGSLLDFGSGAGLPGIPIAMCRPEICITLAESQNKKAAFLQEAVRVLELTARVYPQRAETLTERFDCVVMRAVDRMADAVVESAKLVQSEGWLVLMAASKDSEDLKRAAASGFTWEQRNFLPADGKRMLLLGSRNS